MDGVLKQYGHERKDLDFTECTPKIRSRIAGEITDEWYFIGRELDVAQKTLKSIRHDSSHSPEDKAIAMLDAWADEYGKEATCLKLAEALCQRNKTSVIEKLCEEVTQMNCAAVSTHASDNQQQQHGKTT